MAGERTVVKGIVLRANDSKESDRILTVLTAEMGKISVVAKGARVGAAPETAEDPAQWGIAVLGPNTKLAENEVVAAKTMLDKTHQGV